MKEDLAYINANDITWMHGFHFRLYETPSRNKMADKTYEVQTKLFSKLSYKDFKRTMMTHMLQIIQDIVFPLMSYSESDVELWNTNTYKYIKI